MRKNPKMTVADLETAAAESLARANRGEQSELNLEDERRRIDAAGGPRPQDGPRYPADQCQTREP